MADPQLFTESLSLIAMEAMVGPMWILRLCQTTPIVPDQRSGW